MAVSRFLCRSLMVGLSRLNPSIQNPMICRLGTGLKFTMLLPATGPCPSICRVPVTGSVDTNGDVMTRASSSAAVLIDPPVKITAGRRKPSGYSSTQSFTRFKSSVP